MGVALASVVEEHVGPTLERAQSLAPWSGVEAQLSLERAVVVGPVPEVSSGVDRHIAGVLLSAVERLASTLRHCCLSAFMVPTAATERSSASALGPGPGDGGDLLGLVRREGAVAQGVGGGGQ